MLSVGTIVGDAFGLIRARFGSVLVWGLIYSLGVFALGYFMIASMMPMMAIDQNADPSVAMGAIGSFFGRLMLFYFAFFCLYNVLRTAAQRAMLRPRESGFASLRPGRDELRQIGLSIILAILFGVVYLIAAFILGIVAVAVGVGGGLGAPGGSAAAGAGLGLVMILGILAIFCLMMFLWVRMSLAYPLTLLRGHIVLGEAWQLSRGHFWTLFGAYLVLMLTVFGISIALSALLQGDYWSQVLGGRAADPAAMRAQIEAQYSLGLHMILSLVLGVVVGGVTIALTGGSLASAARALVGDHEAIADTFA
ncbi:MAG TPA: hypothetical protein VLK25_10170 [Allosphingosinicella sp.]|nr:hypothetical protein [Allosphingosinicella sp.]